MKIFTDYAIKLPYRFILCQWKQISAHMDAYKKN